MDIPADGHERRYAARHAQILATATELFLNEGYGRASMDQVLVRVGGSKRTLYKHFPSKEDLFAEIVDSVSARALAALQPPLDGNDVKGTLVAMGTGYLAVLLSAEGLALYRTMVSEAPHFPELTQTFFNNGPGSASRHLASFFRSLKKQGYLDLKDPQLAAEQFLGMVRGDIHLAAVLAAQTPTKNKIAKSVEHAVETFLCGAAPKFCTS